MLKGLIRSEIADLLGISNETVKKHVANIVKKYDVSNQREAVIAIYRERYLYSEEFIDADFYVERRETGIEIFYDGVRSRMEARSKQTVVKDSVEFIEGDVYSDGTVERVEIDGVEVEPYRRERSRYWYRTKFSPALKKGEVVDRLLIANLRDSIEFPRDYFFIEQPKPCGVLVLWVRLEDPLEFVDLEFEAKLGAKAFKPPRQSFIRKRDYVCWTIDAPEILSEYTIRWLIGGMGTI